MARRNAVRGSGLRRKLDLIFGVPVLLCLRLVHIFRRKWNDTGTGPLGFVRTAAIGDTVLLSAILLDARSKWPTRRLVVFLGESNAVIGPLLPGGCDIVLISVRRPFVALRILREYHLETVLDFGPWPRLDALLACGSGARKVAGFSTPGQYRHYAYDVSIFHRNNVHELENMRALARVVGIEPKAIPELVVPHLAVTEILPEKWVALHPWPGGFRSNLREWPIESWRQLADWLTLSGFALFITGGADDAHRVQAMKDDLISHVSGVHLLAFKTKSLSELSLRLKTSRGLISVNTGIMHMAAGLGVPTVALNGPTSTLRWGPVGPKVRSVEPRGGGGGYLNLGFEYEQGCDLDCMKRIHVDDVISALESLWAD